MINLPILRAAAHQVMSTSAANLASLGLDHADFERVISDSCWTGQHRAKNVNTLRSIGEACLISQGIASFEKPAEYTAAIIALFVKPQNWNLACAYFANTSIPSDSLLRDDGSLAEGYEPVSAGKLLTLVLALYGDPAHSAAVEQYHRNVQAKYELTSGAVAAAGKKK